MQSKYAMQADSGGFVSECRVVRMARATRWCFTSSSEKPISRSPINASWRQWQMPVASPRHSTFGQKSGTLQRGVIRPSLAEEEWSIGLSETRCCSPAVIAA